MKIEKKIDKNKLTIPIYLNTKIVFDMLAALEDGFSEVKNIQTSNMKIHDEEVDANIGTSNKFAFLNIGLSARKSFGRKKDEVVIEKKTHTPVSLFQKLMSCLEEADLIKTSINDMEVGDFAVMRGTLKTNPLIDMLSSIKEMANLVELFADNKNSKTKAQKIMENKKFESQIGGLINGLQVDGKKDIICDSDDVRIILTTDESYFLNNNMSEITEGEYKVIGKVIKICLTDGEISLLRNTFFSKLKLDRMKEFQEFFNDDALMPFVGSDKVVTTIEAPVMMMIPIAIYI